MLVVASVCPRYQPSGSHGTLRCRISAQNNQKPQKVNDSGKPVYYSEGPLCSYMAQWLVVRVRVSENSAPSEQQNFGIVNPNR